jgi:hypothetical protein
VGEIAIELEAAFHVLGVPEIISVEEEDQLPRGSSNRCLKTRELPPVALLNELDAWGQGGCGSRGFKLLWRRTVVDQDNFVYCMSLGKNRLDGLFNEGTVVVVVN